MVLAGNWFAELKVRWTSRVIWMAVVSQSSFTCQFGGKALAPVWEANPVVYQLTPKSLPLIHTVVRSARLRLAGLEVTA